MPLHDSEKLNRIEELKDKLSSKNYHARIEHRDSFTHHEKGDVPDRWEGVERTRANFEERFFMKTSMFKKFFIFSVAFFVLTLGYASYVFFAGGNTVSNENIEITIVGNSFTPGGEDLSLVVGITNKNSSPLELVDLVMEYPNSSRADLSAETERIRISLGTIPSGAIRNENVKLVLFGEQGSVRPIKISIEYRVEGSNAIFVKEKIHEVTISSTPINLSIEAPDSISSNQDITLNIKVSQNATRAASKVLVKVDYPTGFQFTSSSPTTFLGNNIWNLGDVPPGGERSISLTGRMLDVFDGEEKTFRVWSGSQSEKDKSAIGVVFNSASHTVLIQKPFIEAKLFVNGMYEREHATSSKNEVNGEIRWVNNGDTKINDFSIQAKISGNAANKKTISAQRGFYNSIGDVIIWDQNYDNKFREVNPGDSGSATFSFSPMPLYSAAGGMLASPSIKIEVSVSGKQLVEGYETGDLKNFESTVVKVISDVGLSAKALYYSGAFKNTGPIPPKAEQETTYTIVWGITNTSNSLSKTFVRATLPPWVRFAGAFKPTDANLAYNASTREITWNVGNVARGSGITGEAKEVSFQIALTPSVSQVGDAPTILREAVLTGHDDFANVDVRTTKGTLNTSLLSDPLFPNDGALVVE